MHYNMDSQNIGSAKKKKKKIRIGFFETTDPNFFLILVLQKKKKRIGCLKKMIPLLGSVFLNNRS